MSTVNPLPSDPETEEWREREASRFGSGDYKRLPWVDEPWWRGSNACFFHYAHVSAEDPSKLAFTESDSKGRQDRQTRVRPGRYLARFFPEMGPTAIQAWAQKFAATNEKHEARFATTPDEIVAAYENGPRSCMASEDCVRVYGAGDLAVAYIGDLSESVTARVLCWPSKKVYGRVYGDESRLVPALESAGFSLDNSGFEGARLLRIEDSGGFVAPYVDGSYRANDNGEHLILSSNGDYALDSQSGYINAGPLCDACEERCDEDETSSVDGEIWCQGCYENGAFYCEECSECTRDDNARSVHYQSRNGQTSDTIMCASCAENDTFSCEGCSEDWKNESAVTADGVDYCPSCAEDMVHYCERCENSTTADVVSIQGAYWGPSCVSDYSEECPDCEERFDSENMREAPDSDGDEIVRCDDCHHIRVDEIGAYTRSDAMRDAARVTLLPAQASGTAPVVPSWGPLLIAALAGVKPMPRPFLALTMVGPDNGFILSNARERARIHMRWGGTPVPYLAAC